MNDNKQIKFSFFDAVRFYFCCRKTSHLTVKKLISIKNYFNKQYSIENLLEVMEKVEINDRIKYKNTISEYSSLVYEDIFYKMLDKTDENNRILLSLNDLYRLN